MMRLAYDILSDIVNNGAYANLALKKALFGVEKERARRVTALVYETIEHIGYADYVIDSYAKGRLHNSIRNVLRLSVTQLLFMDTPEYAAVNGGTELARNIGKAKLCGFVNAVLRRIAKENAEGTLVPLPNDDEKKLSILYGMPEFMVREYIREYGLEFTEKMISSRIHELTVRAQFPTKTNEIEAELGAIGIALHNGKYDENALIIDESVNASELDAFKKGRLTIQSESAMLACRACRVTDDMRILDACAAPGGKSAYLSSLMHGSGTIDAWEAHEHRAKLMQATLDRLHVKNCTVKVRDAAERGDEGEYDVVLVDAPCSGLGGGTKPDALLRRTDEDIKNLAELQKRILLNAATHVKAGGALVYSTCTVSKRENEDNMLWLLEKMPDFELEDISDIIPIEDEAMKKRAGVQLFAHINGTDGFYIARLKRKN